MLLRSPGPLICPLPDASALLLSHPHPRPSRPLPSPFRSLLAHVNGPAVAKTQAERLYAGTAAGWCLMAGFFLDAWLVGLCLQRMGYVCMQVRASRRPAHIGDWWPGAGLERKGEGRGAGVGRGGHASIQRKPPVQRKAKARVPLGSPDPALCTCSRAASLCGA